MRVLVTGGAGFIGSNLVDALLAGGHDVGVIDDLSVGKRDNVPSDVWFHELDILDAETPAAIAEFAPEAVVHLAAQASVGASIRDPARDWAVNAEGTRRVAAAARAAGALRMLSASSAAVYGEPAEADLPLVESAPKAPVNPYGTSKLAAETILAEELAGSGVDYAALRFSNVYGPRQDGAGEGGVVAIFCTRISSGEPPVVNGDGRQTRDFIFVGDIVGAIMAALAVEHPLAGVGADGASFNVSTGKETSVADLLGALRKASGYAGEELSAAAPEGDVARSVLDPAKASAAFEWRARESVEGGVAATWRWFARRS
jgi:UDP-glucose 4-epimerase